jgi:O-antigen chain-terminating methyltransferase
VTPGNARVIDRIRRRIPEGWRMRANAWIGGNVRLRTLIGNALTNKGDAAVIRAELAAPRTGPWQDLVSGRSTVGSSERVIEIPWVISRYRGENRLLDLGTAFGIHVYAELLRKLSAPEIFGVDIAKVEIEGIRMVQADARDMPFPDQHFPLITCISTLEHIGREQTDFGITIAADAEGDVAALKEMRRVLTPEGRILITVPFGRFELHPLMKQYDLEAWQTTTRAANLKVVEQSFYGYSDSRGWHRIDDPFRLSENRYQGGAAIAASGVLCATLTR